MHASAIPIASSSSKTLDGEEMERRCLELETILAELAGVEEFEDLADFAILDLPGEGLTALPESFGLLEELQGVSLANNYLVTLPESFGDLRALQDLNLSNNRIEYLPDSLGQLQKLEELDLGQNKLSYVPHLPKLRNLTKLSLANNSLTGDALPPELGRMVRLQKLDVSGNLLDVLPASLMHLEGLEVLRAESNALRALPCYIGKLSRLIELDVRQNRLTELPPSVSKLTSLTSLSASENELAELPEDLGNLSGLVSLALASNRLGGLPESSQQLRQLQTLDLRSNPFTESKSAVLQPCAAKVSLAVLVTFGCLKELRLQDGQDAASLSALRKVFTTQSLDLSGHRISALPEDVGQLRDVKVFNLRSNQLEVLSPQLCEMRLTRLLLSSNKLSGLPWDLGRLATLQELDVARNRLTQLPESIGDLRNLTKLEVGHNCLSALPKSSGKMSSLASLGLRFNQLTKLPESFDELSALQSLDVSACPLATSLLEPQQGHCPVRRMLYLMSKYDSLTVIKLREEQSGSLPASFADWGQGPPPKAPPGNSARYSPSGCAAGATAPGGWKDGAGYNSFHGSRFDSYEEPPPGADTLPRRLSAAQEAGDDEKLRAVLVSIEAQLDSCPEPAARHKLIRSLFRQWHPDKRRDDQEMATRVFQWLQAAKV